MTYGAGMPILYLLGGLSMLVSYYVDKWLFVRFYRTPPHYNEKLGRSATGLLIWGVALHFAVSTWMYVLPPSGYDLSDGVRFALARSLARSRLTSTFS